MPIYVNENFYYMDELDTYDTMSKLNETVTKSRDDEEHPQVSSTSPSNVSSDKTSSPTSSSSSTSKIRITSYSSNHQNQIELQQQHQQDQKNNVKSTQLYTSRSTNSKPIKENHHIVSSKTNLTLSSSKTKLPVNTPDYKNPNIKLCRIIKSDQMPRYHKKNVPIVDEPSQHINSLFISSASTLLTNGPDEEVSIKANFSTDKRYFQDAPTNFELDDDDSSYSSRRGATKIVDQMASFIDELKDFIEDKLIDTTSQLELANQRISGLYECFHFVASEFSLLKFQNEELLKELRHYYQLNGLNLSHGSHLNEEFFAENSVCNHHQRSGKNNHGKTVEKKSSETSSAISSFPIKSTKKSKKASEQKKNEFSYSSTE